MPLEISFAYEAVHDAAASAEKGAAIFTDQAVATVKIDRNSGFTKPVERVKIDNPQLWEEQMAAAYEAWAASHKAPEEGTSLASLPFITPAVIEMLRAVGVSTVEGLAAAKAAELKDLPGCPEAQKKAKAWLGAAKDRGQLVEKVTRLERELEDANRDLTAVRAENGQLTADLRELQAKLDQGGGAQGKLGT